MQRSSSRLVRRSLSAVLVLTLCWPLIADAVTVAPHALFLGDRNRVGEVVLINQGTRPEEIELEFRFGYPASDSTGNVRVDLIDDPAPDQPSAAGWLRAFPRRLRLEPGQRQNVRVQASPPADLPDGEYWSRMIVTSRTARDRDAEQDSVAVQAGVAFVLRTITSVTYRKGPVATRVRLDSLSAEATADSLIAFVGLTRSGTGAFLGSVALALVGNDGDVVRTWDPMPVAAYYRLLRRYALPLTAVPPGHYQLRVRVSTERQDLPSVHILPADPIETEVAVEVP
jgi:hypothetical protein